MRLIEPYPLRGMMMIELLIALAVFALSISAVAVLRAADARAPIELAGQREAYEADKSVLEAARTTSIDAFTSVVSGEAAGAASLTVADISPCLKDIAASYAYDERPGLADAATLETLLGSVSEAGKMGGDCSGYLPPHSIGALSAATEYSVGTTTALDMLNGTAYIGTGQPPYISIVEDADTAAPIAHTGFDNGLLLSAPPNAIDAVQVTDRDGTMHRYLYAALAATSTQLAVIDVTDAAAPEVTAQRALANVDGAGSYPEGWRLLYYGNRLYVVARETAGRELHIFDVSDPSAPHELGAGIELGITVNDFAVRDQRIGTSMRRYLFAATARDSGEVAVYDVTDAEQAGTVREVTALRTDLPGDQDGLALALNGSRLYIGRAAVPSGPELYAFDTSDPEDGMPLLARADVSAAVTGMRAWGSYLLLQTARSGKELAVWSAASPSAMALVSSTPDIRATGIDIDGTELYALSTDSLRSFPLNTP